MNGQASRSIPDAPRPNKDAVGSLQAAERCLSITSVLGRGLLQWRDAGVMEMGGVDGREEADFQTHLADVVAVVRSLACPHLRSEFFQPAPRERYLSFRLNGSCKGNRAPTRKVLWQCTVR